VCDIFNIKEKLMNAFKKLFKKIFDFQFYRESKKCFKIDVKKLIRKLNKLPTLVRFDSNEININYVYHRDYAEYSTAHYLTCFDNAGEKILFIISIFDGMCYKTFDISNQYYLSFYSKKGNSFYFEIENEIIFDEVKNIVDYIYEIEKHIMNSVVEGIK
jgi:hypothetical protein